MDTFRNWLYSLADEVLARGGWLAVCLYLLVGMSSLPVITGCLVGILIALMFLVPGLLILRALAWISAKLSTRNKTHSSNAGM